MLVELSLAAGLVLAEPFALVKNLPSGFWPPEPLLAEDFLPLAAGLVTCCCVFRSHVVRLGTDIGTLTRSLRPSLPATSSSALRVRTG